MAYAIIKNTKYKSNNLYSLYSHVERKKETYKNKEINLELSKYNYSFKVPENTYYQLFNKLNQDENLNYKNRYNSYIACEFIIKSSYDFFEDIGPVETKRFFETAYEFACKYKNLGEKYILSAIVHMDEITPHMHLIYLPVIHTKDKNNNTINKLSCSNFWKGKNSYSLLQTDFYTFMVSKNFNLERGKTRKSFDISMYDFKSLTNYDKIKEIVNTNTFEELKTNSLDVAISKNKELLKYCHKLETYCISSFNIFNKLSQYESIINKLKQENMNLKVKLKNLTLFISKLIRTVCNHFNIPKAHLIDIIKQDRLK